MIFIAAVTIILRHSFCTIQICNTCTILAKQHYTFIIIKLRKTQQSLKSTINRLISERNQQNKQQNSNSLKKYAWFHSYTSSVPLASFYCMLCARPEITPSQSISLQYIQTRRIHPLQNQTIIYNHLVFQDKYQILLQGFNCNFNLQILYSMILS